MTTLKMSLTLPLLLLAFLTGVCPQRLTEIHVKAGELVALQCPRYRRYNYGDAKLVWTSYTTKEMNLTSDLSATEQNQMGLLVYGRSLVIFNSSVNHQGNYSCTWRNVGKQSWFRLTVCTSQTEEYEESTTYAQKCHEHEACTLNCPDVNIPSASIPNITYDGTTWHKDGNLADSYFPSVRKSDRGVYTCTRSYLYHGHLYNKNFTLVLQVEPKKESEKSPEITSPRNNDVFHVDLGLPKVIDCEAVMYSDFDEVFWLSGTSFVEKNDSLPVFYNYTRKNHGKEIKVKASLVFKKVSEEDLRKKYTCKLESTSYPSSFVTITMALKASSSLSLSMILGIGVIMVVIVLTAVGLYEKGHDASYNESDTDAGPKKDVLEAKIHHNPNILSGKAVAQAVLDFIEQCQTVDLNLAPVDPRPGSDPLNNSHTVLMKQWIQWTFFKTDAAEVSTCRSLLEDLWRLVKARNRDPWKETRSMLPSFFIKMKLYYYQSVPSRAPKKRTTAANM